MMPLVRRGLVVVIRDPNRMRVIYRCVAPL